MRLTLSDGEARKGVDAIAFFITRSSFRNDIELLSAGDTITIDACVERSYFAGRRELRLRIEDVKV